TTESTKKQERDAAVKEPTKPENKQLQIDYPLQPKGVRQVVYGTDGSLAEVKNPDGSMLRKVAQDSWLISNADGKEMAFKGAVQADAKGTITFTDSKKSASVQITNDNSKVISTPAPS